MKTLAVVKQNYVFDEPKYSLYNVNRKWFGLKFKTSLIYVDDYKDNVLVSSVNDVNKLIGLYIRQEYINMNKFKETSDKQEYISYIRNNTRLVFLENSCYGNDKPKSYGCIMLNDWLNRNYNKLINNFWVNLFIASYITHK